MSLATRNFKANVNWKIKNSENGISSTSKKCVLSASYKVSVTARNWHLIKLHSHISASTVTVYINHSAAE